MANNGTGKTPTHIPSPWSGSSGSCHRPAHSVAAFFLSLPSFGCRCFLQLTFPLEASSRLIPLCHRLLSTTSTSTAVWLPLLFRYGVFSISYYFLIYSTSSVCPFASSPSCLHEACHLANRLFSPSSHFLCGSRCSDLLFPHCVTHSEKNRAGFSPSPPCLAAILARFVQYLFVSMFKMFLKSDEAPVISVSEAAFPLGRAYKYTACIFTSTCFKIPG